MQNEFTAVIKSFDELTLTELEEIYRLRVSVFVVEQNCPYQEIDGLDSHAIHIMLRDKDGITAYCRVLDRTNPFGEVAIGRVIAVKRRLGYGTKVVRLGIETAIEYYNTDKIVLEAQTYARGLYEKCGFVQTSDVFLEDGIPHIMMQWTKTEDRG